MNPSNTQNKMPKVYFKSNSFGAASARKPRQGRSPSPNKYAGNRSTSKPNRATTDMTRNTAGVAVAIPAKIANVAVPRVQLNSNPEGSGLTNLAKKLLQYQDLVKTAVKQGKIYTLDGNMNPGIGPALERRGWLRKLRPRTFPKLEHLGLEELVSKASPGNDYEKLALTRLMQNSAANFIWVIWQTEHHNLERCPHMNCIRRGPEIDYTNKMGLIGCAERQHWVQTNTANERMNHPRFYRLYALGAVNEREDFIKDYQRTACVSLLRHVCENAKKKGVLYDADNGKVCTSLLSFAKALLECYVAKFDDNNLDKPVTEPQPKLSEAAWDGYYATINNLLIFKVKFQATASFMQQEALEAAAILRKIDALDSTSKWDGFKNLWIVKPGAELRGSNIHVKQKLSDILKLADSQRSRKYIVQKYIERPLLIYGTKFDMRLYVLLTMDDKYARIWMYDDLYFKFSSQVFSLSNLHESIHLTNNTVQIRYKVNPARDSRLPKCNMWSLEQFKAYLRRINAPPATWERIWNELRANVLATILTSFEDTTFVKNTFDLYGVDFMLDEDYTPILIEFNWSPDCTSSTEVTGRLCPRMQEDLIKVVVDGHKTVRRVGGWVQAYETNYSALQKAIFYPKLQVSGTKKPLIEAKC